MAYEILSIGDGELLYSAFQGAAMVFNNDSIGKLMSTGFTLGILIISFKYITDQQFPLRHALVGLIVYSTMFIPKDTVLIEDIYTGEVRTVANVPLGLAVPMSIVSTMGVRMTDMFETAFSTPNEASLIAHGYLNSLETLLKLRRISIGTAGSSSLMVGDLGKSINGYIENCVMFDLDLPDGDHEVTRETLEKSTDLWEAMKTTFINIDVMLTLPNASAAEQKNCKDAYEAISKYLSNDTFFDALDRHVASVLGITNPDIKAVDRIEVASSALGNVLNDSQIFMRNALMASYLREGEKAFIDRQGTLNLQVQWAGEQNKFNEIAKPLMAFVEMFSVAISPIVAFLSTIGPMGMTMIARYIQMMIWIALWGPLMAICNLYITIVTTRILETAANHAEENGSGLDAMVMHDQLYGTLETWLSAGGMLASSVPALSLMLVYGGSVAATNLAGKMTSGASSSVSPQNIQKPMESSSWGTMGSMAEMSPNTASKKSAMADTNYSASSTFARASQSATDSLKSASSSASETLSKINQLSSRSGTMSSQASGVTSAMNKTITDGSNWSSSDGRTTSSSQSMSQQESESVQAGVNGALKGGLGSDMIGASVQASLMSNSGVSAARAKELGDMAQHVVNSGVMGSDVTTSSSGRSNTSTNQSFESSEEMEALGKQYQSQLNAVKQASEKYTQTATMQDSAGKSLVAPYQDLATRLVNSGALADIKNAQIELKNKMGEKDYGELSKNAQYEINNSSAVLEPGSHEREALSGFLMLNQHDPVKAAEIVNSKLMPTNTQTEVEIGHDAFSKDQQSVDGIVSEKTAGEFRSTAKGGGEDVDGDEGSGSGRRGYMGGRSKGMPSKNEQMPKSGLHPSQANKAMAHSASSENKTARSQGFGAKNSQAGFGSKPAGNSSRVGDLKAKVANELSGYKNKDRFEPYPAKFKEGGHLNPDEINGTNMGLKAGKNFGNAGNDLARDGANAANNKIDSLQNDISNAAKQSVDSFKETFGMNDKKPSKSDIPHTPSNNDLPPIN
ncbi:MAG: conjugal transfer protein TraG N-terminal domain-containing protein [Methylomicrobium sp.]|nr:conjugal transfer protein TraG N-terminal domain-containing protein [Methylomicrobium sp.]